MSCYCMYTYEALLGSGICELVVPYASQRVLMSAVLILLVVKCPKAQQQIIQFLYKSNVTMFNLSSNHVPYSD